MLPTAGHHPNTATPTSHPDCRAVLIQIVALHRFFVVTEWLEEFEEAAAALGQWIKEGKLKYRETIEEGIENAPRAFRMLFTGDNFGKLMVKVADPE